MWAFFSIRKDLPDIKNPGKKSRGNKNSINHHTFRYPSRKAFTIFILAARTDGRKPPRNPIKIEKIKDEIIIDGESANLNSNSEND